MKIMTPQDIADARKSAMDMAAAEARGEYVKNRKPKPPAKPARSTPRTGKNAQTFREFADPFVAALGSEQSGKKAKRKNADRVAALNEIYSMPVANRTAELNALYALPTTANTATRKAPTALPENAAKAEPSGREPEPRLTDALTRRRILDGEARLRAMDRGYYGDMDYDAIPIAKDPTFGRQVQLSDARPVEGILEGFTRAPKNRPTARQRIEQSVIDALDASGGSARGLDASLRYLNSVANTDATREGNKLSAETSRYGYDTSAESSRGRDRTQYDIKDLDLLSDVMSTKAQNERSRVQESRLGESSRYSNALNKLKMLNELYRNPTTSDFYDDESAAKYDEYARLILGELGFAEGGEVDTDTDTDVEVEDPMAEGKTAHMETGDYVVPAEVLRFYGVKFFQSMMDKAESEMEA
jgi:hypothetical protein